jgi:hypothetical protein
MPFTRRALLGNGALAATSLAWPGLARAATPRSVALPSAGRVRADIQKMVDLGPRFTGTAGHLQFVDWLE